jgi:Rrf2 family protein
MLSKKAKYGIRALIHLARHQGGYLVPILTIAKQENIPKKFLEHILLELKRGGILVSKPGKQGGYQLKYPPDTIRLAQVVRLLDGSLEPVPCLGQNHYAACADCRGESQCVIRAVMQEVHHVTTRLLDQTTLAMLLELHLRLNIVNNEYEICI